MASDFKPSAQGSLILLRAAMGVVVMYLAYNQNILSAGLGLVLCIWLDVAIGVIAKSKSWQKNAGDVQLEGFADFLCFIIAPVSFALYFSSSEAVWVSFAVFVLCGIWRIARFHVEGLKSGCYEGLPVTYNGYLFPAMGLMIHYLNLPAHLGFPPFLLVVSALMVSRKIKVPEL